MSEFCKVYAAQTGPHTVRYHRLLRTEVGDKTQLITWRGAETGPILQLVRPIIDASPWNLIRVDHSWKLGRLPTIELLNRQPELRIPIKVYLCDSSQWTKQHKNIK